MAYKPVINRQKDGRPRFVVLMQDDETGDQTTIPALLSELVRYANPPARFGYPNWWNLVDWDTEGGLQALTNDEMVEALEDDNNLD